MNAARAFAADAAPLSAQFIAHELPTDFLADLNARIAALQEAISAQSSGEGNHIAAGAAIDEAVDRGTITVGKRRDRKEQVRKQSGSPGRMDQRQLYRTRAARPRDRSATAASINSAGVSMREQHSSP